MLIAYLRGHLKRSTPYGLRSRIRESIILEAIMAEQEASMLRDRNDTTAAMMTALEHKSREQCLSQIRIRQARISELLCGRIYREPVEERSDISIVQLYRLAEKGNLLEKLNKKHAERTEPWRNVLTQEIFVPRN